MASGSPVHLSDEQLARLQDGNAPAADASHLASCEQCGARLQELRSATAAYAEYLDTVRAPLAPAPPRAWLSLDALIARERDRRRTRLLGWWPAAAVAAACGVAALLLVVPRGSEPPVTAAELLSRSAATPLPAGRTLSVQAGGRTLVRPAVLITEGGGEPAMLRVERAFVAARYDWRDPLSARSFQDWRSQLREKRDSVSVVRADGRKQAYRVRTDTPAGALRSASLTLRAADLRPTAGRFEFESEGTVELAEAPAAPAPAPQPAAVPTVEPRAETPAGPEDTLRVLAALNTIGADVGEPVEVADDPRHGRVLVRASGLSAGRRREIEQALSPLPRVALDLDFGAVRPSVAVHAAPERFAADMPAGVRQRLEERLGGAAGLQETTDRLLDASGDLLARAHALGVLAEKFPPEVEARLTGGDRALLGRLRQRHIAELRKLASRIRGDLKPVLSAAPSVGERDADQTLIDAARNLDSALNRLLAGSYSEAAGTELLAGLARQIDRVDAAIEQ